MGAFDPLLGAFMIGTLANLALFGINVSCGLGPCRRGRGGATGWGGGRLTPFFWDG